MDDAQKDRIRSAVVADLKQACLDLSAAAGELFDLFDQHGLDAVWEGTAGVVTLQKLQASHEAVTSFLRRQTASRMLALGVSPETLMRIGADRG